MTMMECELTQGSTRFRGKITDSKATSDEENDTVCGTDKERHELEPDSRKHEDDEPKNKKDNTKKLLCIKEMPDHLQFNPYILDGYRPLQPPLGCVKSLFQWHNETVNIVTHGKFNIEF